MSSSNQNSSNRSIVDEIFQEIARQLWPIVDKRMVDNEGVDWAASKNRNISGDLSAIVGVILANWESCFSDSMSSYERTFAYEIKDWRNTFAHNSNAIFPDDDVLRICDTAARLFKNMSPSASEKFKKLSEHLPSARSYSQYDTDSSSSATPAHVSSTQRSVVAQSDSAERAMLTSNILDCIASNPGVSARQIAAEVKATKTDVNSILYARNDLFVKDSNSTPGWTAL